MAKKTFTGKVITVIDNSNLKSIVIEIDPGKPAANGKPAVRARTAQVSSNVHGDFDGIVRDKQIKITWEQ